jgi:hypothetical protein
MTGLELSARYGFAARDYSPLVSAVMSCIGELTAREKSMMYLTGVAQKRQGVCWISCTSSRSDLATARERRPGGD